VWALDPEVASVRARPGLAPKGEPKVSKGLIRIWEIKDGKLVSRWVLEEPKAPEVEKEP
jgi:hypothetical protein